jgi:hypothetical protein
MSTPRKVAKIASPMRLSSKKDVNLANEFSPKPLQVRNVMEEDCELTPTNKRIKSTSFDFNAPKYHDFTAEESQQDIDRWFGK